MIEDQDMICATNDNSNKDSSRSKNQGQQNQNKNNQSGGGRGSNLTEEDRRKGGEHSHGGK